MAENSAPATTAQKHVPQHSLEFKDRARFDFLI
jgi:hypothetical protein